MIIRKIKGIGKKNRVRRNHKDALFRKIFSDPRELLGLYNALNDSAYDNVSDLEITTLDDAIFMGYKNDVSFILGSVLNLYEHQSTINPNMPLRGFIYLAEQYDAYIERNHLDIYSEYQIRIPEPRFVVFYNGTAPLEDDKDHITLRLSDAFNKTDKTCLECTAEVYNISGSRNVDLKQKCNTLSEYAEFTNRITVNRKEGMTFEQSVIKATDSCIEDGILYDYLIKNRAEVMKGVLYNDKRNMRIHIEAVKKQAREDALREGREEGLAAGREEGLAAGRAEGREKGLEIGRTVGVDEFTAIVTRLKNGEDENSLIATGADKEMIKKAQSLISIL